MGWFAVLAALVLLAAAVRARLIRAYAQMRADIFGYTVLRPLLTQVVARDQKDRGRLGLTVSNLGALALPVHSSIGNITRFRRTQSQATLGPDIHLSIATLNQKTAINATYTYPIRDRGEMVRFLDALRQQVESAPLAENA